MSLILEALRKSEAERQRAAAPRLHSPTLAPPPPSRSVAGPVLATLAGAALLAGAWWMLQADNAAPKPAPVVIEPVERPVVIDPPAPPPPVEATPAPAVAPPKPVVTTPAPRAEAPAPAIDDAPVAPTLPPAPEPAPAAAGTDDEPPPPGLATLGTEERAALPPLRLSMHVWSADPARRFAIVDGQRVTEGALLAGGTVAQIRRDGVVLEIGARRVLLPRP